MEFGELDDSKKFHKAEVCSKSNEICCVWCKMESVNVDINFIPIQKVKGLIPNKNNQNLAILDQSGI